MFADFQSPAGFAKPQARWHGSRGTSMKAVEVRLCVKKCMARIDHVIYCSDSDSELPGDYLLADQGRRGKRNCA